MKSFRHGPGQGRRAAALVFSLFVGVGLILVFGGALARSTAIEAEAERTRAEIEVLKARVAAGADEIAFYDTEASVLWQARANGYGEPGEQPFRLQATAPSPAPIVPVGPGDPEHRARTPFDAWMDLLFGV